MARRSVRTRSPTTGTASSCWCHVARFAPESRREQVAVGQEGDAAPTVGQQRRVPPAVCHRRHQRPRVQVGRPCATVQHAHHRDQSVVTLDRHAVGPGHHRGPAGAIDDDRPTARRRRQPPRRPRRCSMPAAAWLRRPWPSPADARRTAHGRDGAQSPYGEKSQSVARGSVEPHATTVPGEGRCAASSRTSRKAQPFEGRARRRRQDLADGRSVPAGSVQQRDACPGAGQQHGGDGASRTGTDHEHVGAAV